MIIYTIGHGRHAWRDFLALLLLCLTFLLGFNSSNPAQKDYSASGSPTVTPTPDSSSDSVRIGLDRDMLMYPCPPQYSCVRSGDGNMSIIVTISNVKSKDNSLSYTVSGGRIVGEGAKVTWNLTGALPGTYRITVGVSDESGTQIQTATKVVTVESFTTGDCFCPTLSVTAPTSPTKAGETMIFTATVEGGAQADVTYHWRISDGKIIAGQGTPTIKIKTNSKMAGKTVTATIEIDGVCEQCPTTETGTGKIADKKRRKK